MPASLSNQKNTEASIRNLETQVGQLTKQLADNQGSQFARFMDILKRLQINIPFTEALKQMPTYAKFMKELLTKKRKINDQEIVELEAGCSAIIQKSLPKKSRDLGSFTLQVTIGNLTVEKTLLDLGASINLMSLSMLKKIGDVEVKPKNDFVVG